jgi:3-methyladenine DNA glycosylase/8-oxoguanine DNA glycosylase
MTVENAVQARTLPGVLSLAESTDARRQWPLPPGYDFAETTRLLRTGRNDPTLRREPDGLWRTARLPDGLATVRLVVEPGSVSALAWGPAAEQALDRVPGWLGLDQPPFDLPPHPVTDRLSKQHAGVRLTDTGDAYEALVNITLQQRVTWNEAACQWRLLIETLGEPAPGPADLAVVPSPARLRAVSPDTLYDLGIDRQRARTLREIGFAANASQRAAGLPTAAAQQLLEKISGVGRWTSAMALGLRLGRPEPIVFGDIHLPHMVCWALAREPRGSDRRMQELLAPFEGQAFQVIRLLHAARIEAPRRAPKRELRFR